MWRSTSAVHAMCMGSTKQVWQAGHASVLCQILHAGFGLVKASSFNAAGVGSCQLATVGTGADRLGDRAKHSTVKSSTTKGPTA